MMTGPLAAGAPGPRIADRRRHAKPSVGFNCPLTQELRMPMFDLTHLQTSGGTMADSEPSNNDFSTATNLGSFSGSTSIGSFGGTVNQYLWNNNNPSVDFRDIYAFSANSASKLQVPFSFQSGRDGQAQVFLTDSQGFQLATNNTLLVWDLVLAYII
jgi:hypothetical protein